LTHATVMDYSRSLSRRPTHSIGKQGKRCKMVTPTTILAGNCVRCQLLGLQCWWPSMTLKAHFCCCLLARLPVKRQPYFSWTWLTIKATLWTTKKPCNFYFCDNFGKCGLSVIQYFFPLLQREINCRRWWNKSYQMRIKLTISRKYLPLITNFHTFWTEWLL